MCKEAGIWGVISAGNTLGGTGEETNHFLCTASVF